MDRAIPLPVRDLAAPFLMPIESVHTITGIGTVVTGRVTRGVVAVGDTLELVGRTDSEPRPIVITRVESFHREQRAASAGENVGLRLRNVDRGDIVRGQVLVAPGSVQPHRQCRAELYLLTSREGGRAKPIRAGYRPQLFLGATDVTAALAIADALAPGGWAGRGRPGARPARRARVRCPVRAPRGRTHQRRGRRHRHPVVQAPAFAGP